MLYPQCFTQFTRKHANILAALVYGLLLFLGWFALHLGALELALLLLPAVDLIGGFIGIAMGGAGSNVALETADIVRQVRKNYCGDTFGQAIATYGQTKYSRSIGFYCVAFSGQLSRKY